VTFAPLLHARDQLAGHSHRGLQIDAQGAADLLLREPVETTRRRQPGVRHQDVDRPGICDQLQRGALLGKVRLDGAVAVAGQLRGQALELIAFAGAEDNRGPAPGERRRDRAAKAAGCSGQQGCATRELHLTEPTIVPRPARRGRYERASVAAT
jgi:hypothetical protein